MENDLQPLFGEGPAFNDGGANIPPRPINHGHISREDVAPRRPPPEPPRQWRNVDDEKQRRLEERIEAVEAEMDVATVVAEQESGDSGTAVHSRTHQAPTDMTPLPGFPDDKGRYSLVVEIDDNGEVVDGYTEWEELIPKGLSRGDLLRWRDEEHGFESGWEVFSPSDSGGGTTFVIYSDQENTKALPAPNLPHRYLGTNSEGELVFDLVRFP